MSGHTMTDKLEPVLSDAELDAAFKIARPEAWEMGGCDHTYARAIERAAILKYRDGAVPVLYQQRSHPLGDDWWGEWADCSKEEAERILRKTIIGRVGSSPWEFQVRKLYAVPAPMKSEQEIHDIAWAIAGVDNGGYYFDTPELMEFVKQVLK